MYQSPDYVKVGLDVKDNYAAYNSCYEVMEVTFQNAPKPGGLDCTENRVISGRQSEFYPTAIYECWNSNAPH